MTDDPRRVSSDEVAMEGCLTPLAHHGESIAAGQVLVRIDDARPRGAVDGLHPRMTVWRR